MDNKENIVCPNCSQRLSVPSGLGVLAVTCPTCRFKWDWPAEAKAVGEGTFTVSASPEPEPRPIRSSREEESSKSDAQRNDLLQYTLNTGHTWPIPRTQVPSYAIDQAKCMLTNGRHPINLVPGGYECDITITKHALMATVYKGERPLVTFGVAPNVEASVEFWMAMVATYSFFRDGILRSVNKHMMTVEQVISNPPKSVPWCAVIALLIQDGELWLANFEQMLAWAWIEKTRSSDAK